MSEVVRSTEVLRRTLVLGWGFAFGVAILTLFYYRNFPVGGLIRLQSEQVAPYALSILNVFSGPLLSIVFFSFEKTSTLEISLSREHALLAICATAGALILSLFQFCTPVIMGLKAQETISDRIGEVDAFLSIINTAFVLPLNVMVFSSKSYAE
jgi:hypothetical protein